MKRILIVFIVLLMSTAALAQPRRPERGPRPGGKARLAELLDLTEAQKARLAQFRETERNAVEPLRQQLRANREKVEAALAAGDANAAGTMMLANHRLRQQVRAAHEAFAASLRGILTAEQQAKLDVLRELRERRHRRPRA